MYKIDLIKILIRVAICPFLSCGVSSAATVDCSHIFNDSNIESAFVDVAPKFLQVFELFKNPEKMRFATGRLNELKLQTATPQIENEILLLELLVNPETDPSKQPVRLAILNLMAQTISSHNPSLSLTAIEHVAIYSYTTEDYRAVNPELRKVNPSKDVIAYRDEIRAALSKFPPYIGMVKRGVNLGSSDLAGFEKGSDVTFRAFSSATADLNLTRFESPVRLLIHSLSGKNISSLSANPAEREVLFDSDSKFKVLRVSPKIVLAGVTAELEIELQQIL